MANYNDQYDTDKIGEAETAAGQAASYVDSIYQGNSDIEKKAAEAELDIQTLTGDENEALDKTSKLTSTLKGISASALRAMLLSGSLTQDQLIAAVKDGTITISTLIEAANGYALSLASSDSSYNKKLKAITNINSLLAELGLSKEKVNQAMSSYLIKNDLMYTGAGAATAGCCLIGFLAMFGYKLPYEEKGFESVSSGLYLGDSDSTLQALDCNHWYNWCCRCAGVAAVGRESQEKYKLALEPGEKDVAGDDIRASYGEDYFTQGKAGDLLSTYEKGHDRMIIGNDGNGYWVTEEAAGGAQINYYTYEQLKAYRVTNMDSLFSNKTYQYNDGRQNELGVSGEQCMFMDPDKVANMVGIEDPNLINSLKSQYNSRNKTPITNAKTIDVPDGNTQVETTVQNQVQDKPSEVQDNTAQQNTTQQTDSYQNDTHQSGSSSSTQYYSDSTSKTEVVSEVTPTPLVNDTVNEVTPTQTTRRIINNVTENHYYNYSNSNQSKTETSVEPETLVATPTEEITEVIPEIIPTVETPTVSTDEPTIESNGTIVNEKTSTNIWPAVGIGAAAVAAAIGAKTVYEKKQEEKENTEYVPEPEKQSYGYGYNGMTEIKEKLSKPEDYGGEGPEDYYEE